MATQITPQEQQYIDQIRAGIPQDVTDRYARDSTRLYCYFSELRRDYPEAYNESLRTGNAPFYESPLLPRDKAERLREFTNNNNSSYFAMERAAEEQAQRLGVADVRIADNTYFTIAAMANLQQAQTIQPQCDAISSAPEQGDTRMAQAAPASRAATAPRPHS